MPVYESSDQLYNALKSLLRRVAEKDPSAVRAISNSKLIMRMRTAVPVTETSFNGRHTPLQIIYGPSGLRSDIELEIPADLLHGILLADISLGKAYATGKIKLRGPVWKARIFENIFVVGQQVYPAVLAEFNIDGHKKS
jgi:hypothetical protein